ncbi:MAG: sugar transferase [Clostridiaceae bacterium]
MVIKRLFDIVISLIALVILSPVLLVTAIMIRYKLQGGPVFFQQDRIGKNGKVFNIIKFRTMLDLRDEQGKLLPDEKRVTSFGQALRSLSIDELPQLLNVLKGNMSLVGPRPLLAEYRNLYSEKQFRRHEVLPGITGWAQVNGRNSITWSEKFDMDVWYVNNRSLILDIKIIMLTVLKVLRKMGVNQEGIATVEKFNGFN